MQTYMIEYRYGVWSSDGNGFKYTPDYYNYEKTIIKAQDIDHLRLKIINELAKGKPFRSYIYKLDKNGKPNYDSPVGNLFHYRNGYVWFIRNTKRGWDINPKTGKKR